MIAIFHFSAESAPLPGNHEHVWDKLLHALEYRSRAAVLRALTSEGLGWLAALATAVLLADLYGMSDECTRPSCRSETRYPRLGGRHARRGARRCAPIRRSKTETES